MIHGIIIILPNKRSDIVIGEDKVRILITVPKEMKKDLELLAEKETRNVSNLIVAVLKDYIKNNK
jgi:metal-responsive CopG/Arc/MetJ family transcriptional regulator